MHLRKSKEFVKQYKKLPSKVQEQFNSRLLLWLENPNHPQLRNHPLVGKYLGYWSFNVTGDVRVIYKHVDDEIVILALIGTHSRLY